MMKVIHFLTSIDKSSGGVTAYLELLSRGLKNQLDLIVATGTSDNPIEIQGVRIDFFKLSLLNIFKLSNSFKKYLKSENPDLVHINGIWEPYNWLFQKEAIKLGIKVVLSPHGMLEPYILNRNKFKKKIALKLYQNKAIKLADYIHATAKSEIDQINFLGYNNKSTIIPNGVDLREIVEKENFKFGEKKIFLFLSRIHPKKGLEVLIDAVNQIEQNNIIFYIAGEGEMDYVNELINKVKNKDLDNKIFFLGGVYGEEKWKLFKKSNFFVLPTLSENFGIVIAEALAIGLPVITTSGSPWQEINTFKCGWCIDLSIENLKNSIESALMLTELETKEMGVRGRALVHSNYDIVKITNKMCEFYFKIMES
jgi:glycosyltransferase involved in cell wall biosynthesis